LKVSVVIVNWNGMETLPACLQGLRQQEFAPHEVIVVDNGSVDGSIEFLSHCDMDNLKVIRLPENRGFSGGNNAAWSEISGDIVALLNNDAVAQPGWISNAIRHFQNDGLGMVASKIVRIDAPDVLDKAGHLIFPDGLNRGRGTGKPAEAFNRFEEALWPDGCAAFYRKTMLERIGFFDDDFYLYGEDADLGFRARWAGFGCVYDPECLVHHHHSASLGKFSPQKVYFIERNRIWVLVKNFPLSWILVSPIYTLGRFLMNGLSIFSGRGSAAGFKQENGAWSLLKALLKASWDGVIGIPRMWRKRRRIPKEMTTRQMKQLLKTYRIGFREITLAD